jgi:hypothetical protein
MAYLFPGGLIPWTERRFTDANGVPLANGFFESYIAGTSTPLETYNDADLNTANPVVMVLNDNGCTPFPTYLLPRMYKIIIRDFAGIAQPHYPFDNVGDIGQIFAEYFGTYSGNGSKDVTSGYLTVNTDHFITVASTGGVNPCIINLASAAIAIWPLTIKNEGTVPLSLQPWGSNTIDGSATPFVVPAAAYPVLPAITLQSDGVSAWKIVSSHGVA